MILISTDTDVYSRLLAVSQWQIVGHIIWVKPGDCYQGFNIGGKNYGRYYTAMLILANNIGSFHRSKPLVEFFFFKLIITELCVSLSWSS